MPPSLEDRVRSLERSQMKLYGELNASNQMLLDLWTFVLRSSADPRALADKLHAEWLSKSTSAGPDFHGLDPAYLDAAAQEYHEALERLSKRLRDYQLSSRPWEALDDSEN